MTDVRIIPLPDGQRAWALETLEREWGSLQMMSRWRYHDLTRLEMLSAMLDEDVVGLASFYTQGQQAELVTLNSFRENIGVGEALLFSLREIARERGCKKLWLTTSNDNMRALQFYQKRGMAIVAVHRFAIDVAREKNIHIPTIGQNGIPCRDELELEMLL